MTYILTRNIGQNYDLFPRKVIPSFHKAIWRKKNSYDSEHAFFMVETLDSCVSHMHERLETKVGCKGFQ